MGRIHPREIIYARDVIRTDLEDMVENYIDRTGAGIRMMFRVDRNGFRKE